MKVFRPMSAKNLYSCPCWFCESRCRQHCCGCANCCCMLLSLCVRYCSTMILIQNCDCLTGWSTSCCSGLTSLNTNHGYSTSYIRHQSVNSTMMRNGFRLLGIRCRHLRGLVPSQVWRKGMRLLQELRLIYCFSLCVLSFADLFSLCFHIAKVYTHSKVKPLRVTSFPVV